MHEHNVRDVTRALDQQLRQANDEIQVGSVRPCSVIPLFDYFVGVEIGTFTTNQSR